MVGRWRMAPRTTGKAGAMSIELAQAVMDRSKALGPDKSILIIYAFHADDETGICWPSNETVAKKSGYNEKTVQRAKAHLLNIGELKLLQGGNTVGRSRKTDTLQV